VKSRINNEVLGSGFRVHGERLKGEKIEAEKLRRWEGGKKQKAGKRDLGPVVVR